MQLCADETGGGFVAGIARGPRGRRHVIARLAYRLGAVVASRAGARRNTRMVEGRSGPGRAALVATVAWRRVVPNRGGVAS